MPQGESVRVRYAPSPTGAPHIGNTHTALFNWLFARHSGGRFIVRIEDTDRERYVPGSLETILEGLRWLGIDWDEGPEVGGPKGPYFQSQRLKIYQQFARRLVETGHAYYCYCSQERLEEMRREQAARKEPPGYDRRCRDLTSKERGEFASQGIVPVVRLKVPLEGKTTFHDLIHGTVTFDNRTLDDMVLLKSDGYPTYHLAVVVDDHLMEITHIMRGDEWVPSVPRHILLYQALGWDPPKFVHLPMLLGPDRSKLSKRHGAASVLGYKANGYLPEAVLNFLAIVGWAYDDKTEIFTRDELIQRFSIQGISHTPAIFSQEKMDWMNGYYIRQLPTEELARRAMPFLAQAGLIGDKTDIAYLHQVMPLVQERIKKLTEVAGLIDFLFLEKISYDPALLIGKGMDSSAATRALESTLALLKAQDPFDAVALEAALRALVEQLGLTPGQLFGTIRVAVSGKTVAPPLFESLAVLGRDKTLKRLAQALELTKTL
jgi:glutamyl-tRNA synthetase